MVGKASQGEGGAVWGRKQGERDRRELQWEKTFAFLIKLHFPYLQTKVSSAATDLQRIFQMLYRLCTGKHKTSVL